jgi:hypothetical protein
MLVADPVTAFGEYVAVRRQTVIVCLAGIVE